MIQTSISCKVSFYQAAVPKRQTRKGGYANDHNNNDNRNSTICTNNVDGIYANKDRGVYLCKGTIGQETEPILIYSKVDKTMYSMCKK
jgi:hypothetical protein